MKGTIPQKVGRVVSNLALCPRYLPRYLGHNLMSETTPLDLELPWFSYAAIDFLNEYLTKNMNVCEYGSGGSTLFCARRTGSVFAIEDNTEWFQLVQDRLRDLQITHVTVRWEPFDFQNPVGFEESGYLHAMPDTLFDVIIVDGTEEWIPVRPICFEHAERHIKPGGIIVVDDSWRYPTLRENHRAQRLEIFKSVGPCRPGVTTTDVFFY